MSVRWTNSEDLGTQDDREPRTQRRHDVQEDDRPTPPTSPERGSGNAILFPTSTHPFNAVEAARTDLFATMTRTKNNQKPKTVALNIATAQRLVLADMQHDIAMRTEVVLGDSVQPRDIRELGLSVRDYCKCIVTPVIMGS